MSEQPLREPAFLVLTALAGGPLHGYALVEDVLRLSDGQVRLHTGTLYGVLDRLREAGLIVVDREEIVESRLRRYYTLTDAGIARLATETERMRRNASAAESRAPPAAARGGRNMRRRRDTPRTDGGARREPAAEALERRYRRLLAWYPAAYRAANADDMLGVALARSASGQRWPEPGEAVNLIVSGTGERLAGMLRQPDQRDTAAVLAIAGPLLLAAGAVRTMASPFLFRPAIPAIAEPQRTLVTAIAFAAWWTLVALAGMLRWRRVAATGACLGLAGQVVMLALAVSGNAGPLMVAYWQAAVALVTAASALGSLRSQGGPLSWRAVTALAAAAAILAGWPAVEVAFVTYTPVTANSGTISDPLSGSGGWLGDGLLAVTLILMLAAIAALRPAVRRRSAVLLLPAFVTTTLACWGFRGFLPTGTPFGALVLSPFQWQILVQVPVIGVVAGFIGLRLYERLLRRRESGAAGKSAADRAN